jgi:predicted MFS family arabinose efflux permease
VLTDPITRRRVATAAIVLSLVVAAFEGTGVTGAMPSIAASLGGLAAYSWVFSAFLIASTLGVLTCGKLADAHGRRPVFAVGMGLFLVASAGCGAARSMEALVFFRVLQGLGAGAIQPVAMTISADLYSMTERARVQALFTATWGAANALGPLLGGFLVVHLSWRWVFFVNVPAGLLAVTLLFASFRDPLRVRAASSGAGGAALAGLAAGLVLLAIEPAGLEGAPRFAFAAAAIVAVVLVARQQRRSSNPVLAPALLRSPVIRAGLLAGMFAGGLLYATTAYVPLWMAQKLGRDAIGAGAALIPLLVGWSVGSTFGVHVLVRHGMRASVAGGFAVALVGAIGLAVVVRFQLPIGAAYAALGVLGLGVGPAASTALIAPQSQVAWDQRGMITSAVYAARMLGGALFVAVLGSVHASEGGVPAVRFESIAALALAALVLLVALAPSRLEEAPRESSAELPPASA